MLLIAFPNSDQTTRLQHLFEHLQPDFISVNVTNSTYAKRVALYSAEASNLHYPSVGNLRAPLQYKVWKHKRLLNETKFNIQTRSGWYGLEYLFSHRQSGFAFRTSIWESFIYHSAQLDNLTIGERNANH